MSLIFATNCQISAQAALKVATCAQAVIIMFTWHHAVQVQGPRLLKAAFLQGAVVIYNRLIEVNQFRTMQSYSLNKSPRPGNRLFLACSGSLPRTRFRSSCSIIIPTSAAVPSLRKHSLHCKQPRVPDAVALLSQSVRQALIDELRKLCCTCVDHLFGTAVSLKQLVLPPASSGS